jgi:glycosyltransferase involved in cell wall biosynthesis
LVSTTINEKKHEVVMDTHNQSRRARATNPLVSVVIPTRGRSEIVCRAVRSALDQTFRSVEVIVVVDGEDPVTVRALESLGDSRVQILALVESQGGSEARNIGVRAARGNWIAFLDDDDEWLPHKLEEQVRVGRSETGQSVLITCRRFNREPGQPDEIAPWRLPWPNEDISEYMFCPSDGRRQTSGPQTSGYLGTRKLFFDLPFTPGLKCHQDWDWYLRAMRHESTVSRMLEEPLYIMHKERERPSMTQQARWETSLNWANSRKNLMTQRAFKSFLIHDCMYRCEITRGRLWVFQKLLAACRASGDLGIGDVLAAAKWYLFRPALRLRLRGFTKRLRAVRSASFVNRTAAGRPRTQESQG